MSTSPSASSSSSSSGYQSALSNSPLSRSGSSTPLSKRGTPMSAEAAKAEATVAAAAARLRKMYGSGEVPLPTTPFKFPENVTSLNQKIEHLKKALNDKTKGKYTLESLEEAFKSIDMAYRIDKVAGKSVPLRNSFKNLKTQFFAHKAEVESSQVKQSIEISKKEIKELISTANRFIRRIEKGEISDSQKIKNIEWLKELVRSCPDFVPNGLKAKIQGIDELAPLYYRMDVLKGEINELQKNYDPLKDLGIFAKFQDVMWSFKDHINNRSGFRRLKDAIFGSKEITAYKELKEAYYKAFPAEKEGVVKSSSESVTSTSSDKNKKTSSTINKEFVKSVAVFNKAFELYENESDPKQQVELALSAIEKYLDCEYLVRDKGSENIKIKEMQEQIFSITAGEELLHLAVVRYSRKKPQKSKEFNLDEKEEQINSEKLYKQVLETYEFLASQKDPELKIFDRGVIDKRLSGEYKGLPPVDDELFEKKPLPSEVPAPAVVSASRASASTEENLLNQVSSDKNGHYLEPIHKYLGDLFTSAAAPSFSVCKRKKDSQGVTAVNIIGLPSGFNVQIREQDLLKSQAQVIVNAANTHLGGGAGIDEIIHKAGGSPYKQAHQSELKSKYASKGGFKEGFSAMISSGNLKKEKNIENVIVVAGPSSTTQSNKDDALYSCYYNSLVLAHSQGKTSIAFPSISTGIFGFSKDKAAQISLRAISDFTKKFPKTQLKTISICIMGSAADSVLKSYEDLMDIM